MRKLELIFLLCDSTNGHSAYRVSCTKSFSLSRSRGGECVVVGVTSAAAGGHELLQIWLLYLRDRRSAIAIIQVQ